MEYQRRNKANEFIDRRFGQRDKTLSAEERALMRFQKETLVHNDSLMPLTILGTS